MMVHKKDIGANIREVRLEKKLSQEKLANACGFANTMLSAYETGRKTPGLDTIALLAKALDVSIERLYYGDENNSFITSEPDEGKKIVNSLYLLWSLNIVSYYEKPQFDSTFTDLYNSYEPEDIYLHLKDYEEPIKRLFNSLNAFKANESTFHDPDKYLELLKSSVAAEINSMKKRIRKTNYRC